MPNNKSSILSCLDRVYLLMFFFLLVIILIDHNIIDVVYLGLVTFYYIRIKLYRKNK